MSREALDTSLGTSRVCALLTLLLCWLLTPALFGQGFGSIQGTITDPSGAIVPSVTITAINTQTKTSTTIKANTNGFYVFPSLLPEDYTITVSAPSFQKYVHTGIILQADQSATVNIVLALGKTSQTVTVRANSNSVDTTTGTLSEVIDTQQINNLPLNGRNAAVLTELAAGVVIAPNDASDQGSTKTFPVAVTVSVNGSRSNQTDYLLNGGNNIDEYTNVNQPFPFPDAIEEFSVQTNNYDAQYGQNAGGVVNIVSKSGGQSFHGDIFEYIRNAAFNAKDYFTPVGNPKDPLKRNQYGGTVGGPVKIPSVLSGQHTFFFFGYQKTHTTDKALGKPSFVPTEAELTGDFSALLTVNPSNPLGKATQVLDPVTGAPFVGNQVPTSRFDPAAVAFAQALPQVTGNGQVYVATPSIQNFTEYFARVDQYFRSADHIFGHYYYNNFINVGSFDPKNLLTATTNSDILDQSALISETHTFSPNLLNVLVVNFARENATRGPAPGSLGPDAYGVKVYVPRPASIQGVSVSGAFSVGTSQPSIFGRENYTLGDDLHLVKGNHDLAFGVHAEISRVNINGTDSSGNYTFTSQNTNSVLVSFMLGYMSQFHQSAGQQFNGRNKFWGVYAQDRWKVTRRLTLSYGLRYEPFSPWHEIKKRFEIFDPAGFAAGKVSTVYTNAPPGLYFFGDKGVPANGDNVQYAKFSPRFGFAYDVFGTGRTVVRGGGGVFYDSRPQAIDYADATNDTPFALGITYTFPQGPFSNPYLGQTNPYPTPSPLPHDAIFPEPVLVNSTPPNAPAPVNYAWNLTVGQQLTKHLGARIGYVGSHTNHLWQEIELNPAVYTPGSSTTSNTDARRRYLGYGSITQPDRGANASYNSLQATLQQRYTNVAFLLNYTWSKATNDMPYLYNEPYVFPSYFPNFKSLDIGLADWDVKNVLSASYIINFPIFSGGNPFIRAIVNNWATTGIVMGRSGSALTALSGQDRSLTGLGSDRAQIVPGVNSRGSGKQYLNPAAFTQPATGDFGNDPKGSLRGPGYIDLDVGLQRTFPIYKEFRGELRAEYFNVLNHPNYAAPSTTISSSAFGVINSDVTSNFRTGQLALKLFF